MINNALCERINPNSILMITKRHRRILTVTRNNNLPIKSNYSNRHHLPRCQPSYNSDNHFLYEHTCPIAMDTNPHNLTCNNTPSPILR